jgi:hypothetical protein
MRLGHRIGIFVVVVGLGLAMFAGYLGVFSTLVVTEGSPGSFVFVYREMRGTSMSEVEAITSELSALLEAQQIRRQPLDAFFPDGRAEIGFAVSGVDAPTLAALASHMKHREVLSPPSMVARFPWRNRLSFIVGAAKADRAFAAYRAAHSYAKVEAYMLNMGETILFFQPIRAVAQ